MKSGFSEVCCNWCCKRRGLKKKLPSPTELAGKPLLHGHSLLLGRGGGVAVIHFNSIRKDKKLFFHLY